MALKGLRKVAQWDTAWIYDDTITADVAAGGIVALKTAGSGEALDSSANVCAYHSNGSGVMALGILVAEITTDNVTANPRNLQRNKVPKGSKVELIRVGEVLTNMVLGTPTAGANAELAAIGFIALGTHTQTVGNVVVGKFLDTLDEDGYVKVYVNCPAT